METSSLMTTLITFNAGLFHGFIAEAPSRRAALIEALARVKADVVCLQEVWPIEAAGYCWSASEIEAIIDGLAPVYPHAYAGLGAFRDDGFVCGGHHGLLTLSRHRIVEASRYDLPSTLIQRAVLCTRVEIDGFGTTRILNTHLAADLSHFLPYPGGQFGSYAEEQARQIDLLVELVASQGEQEPVVIAGDFNAGPRGASVAGELPENYERLRGSRFIDAPIEVWGGPRSTFSASNTLTETESERMLDHIFIQDDPQVLKAVDADLLWDQPMVITPDGASVHLSDHYGIAVTLEKIR
jgi:endonuclease/exonuclease/phosphatase family metal-dependent hydrolase